MYTMRSPPVSPLWMSPTGPPGEYAPFTAGPPYPTPAPAPAQGYARPDYPPGQSNSWAYSPVDMYVESPVSYTPEFSMDMTYSVGDVSYTHNYPMMAPFEVPADLFAYQTPVHYSPASATIPKRRKVFHTPVHHLDVTPIAAFDHLPIASPVNSGFSHPDPHSINTALVRTTPDSTHSTCGSKREASSSGDDSFDTPPRKPKRARNLGNDQMKLETSLTRITGACIACQRKKIRCKPAENPHGDCLNCAGALLRRRAESTVHSMPCIRAKITATFLFRNGPTDEFLWTRRWIGTTVQEISAWAQPDKHVIRITQDRCAEPLDIVVKEYVPTEGDQLHYSWKRKDGSEQDYRLGPYALADVENTKKAFEKYMDDQMNNYLTSCLSGSRPIVLETFTKALEMSLNGGSQLVLDTLRLFVAARFIEDQWRVCGGHENLDMRDETDEESPYFGKTPVTPIIDFQIDSIVINTILKPLKSKILQTLQEKILKTKPDMDWLEIKITTFILLTNLEWCVRHDNEFARRYALPTRFSNPGLINDTFQSGTNLLWHFKAVAGGSIPFFLDWKETDGQEKPGATSEEAAKADQVAYIKRMKMLAAQESERLAKLREDQMYEEEMFWSGQMFVQDWSPVSSPPADMPATPEPLPDMGFVTEIRDDSEESWEFLD